MAANTSGLCYSRCPDCGKVFIDMEATATCDSVIRFKDLCKCTAANSFDYEEPPVEITSVEDYLKYNDKSTPSKEKRLKNRAKRRKRR